MQKVRRPEFRKARKHRRQWVKRHPLSRLFRDSPPLPLFSPMPDLSWITKHLPENTAPWKGNAVYFDLVIESGPSTDQ